MKNKHLVHHHESAKIYRHYYKPSFSIVRLIKSVLAVIISGTSPAAANHYRRHWTFFTNPYYTKKGLTDGEALFLL